MLNCLIYTPPEPTVGLLSHNLRSWDKKSTFNVKKAVPFNQGSIDFDSSTFFALIPLAIMSPEPSSLTIDSSLLCTDINITSKSSSQYSSSLDKPKQIALASIGKMAISDTLSFPIILIGGTIKSVLMDTVINTVVQEVIIAEVKLHVDTSVENDVVGILNPAHIAEVTEK